MKKIIPIITFIGLGTMLTGCNSVANISNNTVKNQIKLFQDQVEEYSNSTLIKELNTKFKKYNLTVQTQDDTNGPISSDINNLNTSESTTEIEDNSSTDDNSTSDINNLHSNLNTTTPTNVKENIPDNKDLINYTNDNTNQDNTLINNNLNEISTLYSLSSDVSESCEHFCELKEEIKDAILETQNLISKIQSNNIDLTYEQKMLVSEQARELKSLGRQLSNITTELNFNLSDISSLIRNKNGDFDALSLKYLIVLDNLVNGNEMLESGLSSLYMINNMLIPNTENITEGRIYYSQQQNNEEPIIKDYIIKNGEISENSTQDESNIEKTETNGNLDTYLNTNANKNLDTYGNNFSNIDTFFNTALLDNELYGNTGMYGYNNLYNNPNINRNYYPLQNSQESISGVNNEEPNRDIVNKDNSQSKNDRKKKFKIISNIDTYRDSDTPTISAKLKKIKDSVLSFFNKFKPKDNVENPIYKLTDNEND